MPTVLVTGARGFIGRHLSGLLHARGHRVLGIGHGIWPEADARRHGVDRWLNAEVHASALRSVTGDTAPELIFHLAGGSSVAAAMANPREDFVRTVSGTMELLEWMRHDAPHARLVAISSAAVYGNRHSGPINEAMPYAPVSPYGHHKVMMEMLCRSYGDGHGLATVIARPFSVYGAGLLKQLPWDLCTRLATRQRLVMLAGTGQETRDWTHVSDVVEALDRLPAMASPLAPALNVGTGLATPVSSVAAWIAECFANLTSSPTAEIRFSGVKRGGDPSSLVADPTKARANGILCDREPRTGLQEFVRRFVAEWRSVS